VLSTVRTISNWYAARHEGYASPIVKGMRRLEHDRLVTQLTSLERRTARGGEDSIDHAPGAHDDIANAVAGALVTAYKEPGVVGFDRPIVFPKVGVA
jgi:hypothetical protein